MATDTERHSEGALTARRVTQNQGLSRPPEVPAIPNDFDESISLFETECIAEAGQLHP